MIGIPGSLRRDSFNLRLLENAQSLVPERCQLSIEPINHIPLYNADLEHAEGIPASVERLKDRIAASDGLLIATPEYNNSMPGVLKNAIDWLSRPPADKHRVFGNRPVALIGATPGRMGTVLAQAAWLPVFRTLGLRLWTGHSLYVSRARDIFDEHGHITDESLRDRLREFVEKFAAHVVEHKSST